MFESAATDTAVQLPASVFRAIPVIGNARVLATAYNARLFHSLEAVFTQLGGIASYQGPLPFMEVAQLAPERKYHPSLYRLYFHVCDSIAKNHVPSPHIYNLVALLRNMPDAVLKTNRLLRSGWVLSDLIYPLENTAKSTSFGFDELSIAAFADEERKLRLALNLLETVNPAIASEINILVSRIFLFTGRTVVGLTSPRFHGAIFLAAPRETHYDPTYYVEHIVHETSHIYLNTILAFDPLVVNNGSADFEAPIRRDKRPLLGVFHATFVLFRITRVLSAAAEASSASDRINFSRAEVVARSRFEKGMNVLKKHAILTDWGQRIYQSMRD